MDPVAHVEDNDIPVALRKRWVGQRQCTYSVNRVTCTKKHFAKGLCQAHYMRKRRNGDCGEVEVAPTPSRHLHNHQVVMARRRVRRGDWTVRDAADYFGCCYTTMIDAIRGRTFKDLNDA